MIRILVLGVASSLQVGDSSVAARAAAPPSVATPHLVRAADVTGATIVKFVDGSRVRLRDGALVSLAGDDLAGCSALLSGASVERLFRRGERELDEERAALLSAPSSPDGRPPADLNGYYRVRGAPSPTLASALTALPEVEVAYPEPSPASLRPLGEDIAPPTPLFEWRQGYLESPPLGVGHDDVVDLVGATGPDLRVYQIEFEWFFGHEDACRLVRDNVVGEQPLDEVPDGFANHGTAVAGILTADRNEYGVRGMASDADLRVCSAWTNLPVANAISLCTADARPGDVFVTSMGWLLETGVLAPIDYFPAEFDAVRGAVTKGITYCFGAGNRADQPEPDLGDRDLFGDRYVPGAPDSGGVIVGGGKSSSLQPWPDSNYGERVDCHGWAENITTLAFGGDLFSARSNQLQDYTAVFYGTSGAGPVVAGAAAALLGIVREQNGRILRPLEVRRVLRTLGTPQTGAHHIGPRPDLERFLAAYGLPDGLRVRETAGGKHVLDATGPPGGLFVLAASDRRGRSDVGLNRDVLIGLPPDSLRGQRFDASGKARIALSLEIAPMGRTYFQILRVERAGSNLVWHLSNSVEWRADG